MSQAKGVLPRDDDRAILYHNAQTCGYFVGVKLDPAMDDARLEALLKAVDGLVGALVTRVPTKDDLKGDKVAAVAAGFARGFFIANDAPRFATLSEPPASFAPGNRLPNESAALVSAPLMNADVMFYIAAVFEARVNTFVSELANLRPDVQSITMDRGYQRLDDTEPFGYLDGVRNIVPATGRSKHVFVHRDDRDVDEPAWADDGTYMAYMKILQHPGAFAALADNNARDTVIGRRKDGSRLDLPPGTNVKSESPDVPVGLPPASHVRKAGPRGAHDHVQIFRRGLPFIETTDDGQVRVGLNFCSFQASLEQLDTMLNGWMMEPRFPVETPGVGISGADALLDPTRGLTSVEKIGFFFVPPHQPDGLFAALQGPRTSNRKPKSGRLMVRKRVDDPSDPNRRFELAGFTFQVSDASGQLVGQPFQTDSTGRAVCAIELLLNATYTLTEVSSPLPGVPVQPPVAVDMDRPNKSVRITNMAQAGSPYGAV